MKHTGRKRGLRFLLGALAAMLVGAWAWQVYRQIRQSERDHALIEAIKYGSTKQALDLPSAGADANARDVPPETRPIWQQIWDDLRGKHNQVGEISPTALMVLLAQAPHAYYQGSVRPYWVYQAVPDIPLVRQKYHVPVRNSASPVETTRIAKALLANGASVHGHDEQGSTPLSLAVNADLSDIVLLLLAKGENPNELDKDRVSPLHMAVYRGNTSTIQRLLALGALVNAREVDGSTPLFEAVQESHETAVRLLLEHGATVDVRDTDGRTILYYAAQKGNRIILNLLLTKCDSRQINYVLGSTPGFCDTPVPDRRQHHKLSHQVIHLLKDWEAKRLTRH